MLNNINYIIVIPFLSLGIILFQFFLLQLFSRKKMNNFIISTSTLIIINLIYLILNLKLISIFYSIFILLTVIMNIYIFLNIIQLPVSSIQINILRVLNKRSMTKKQLLLQYNDSKIFNIRFKKLYDSNVIKYVNKKITINSNFLIFTLNIFLYLNKIIKNK